MALCLGCTPDIIWSFDLSELFPLRYFSNVPLRIFHPVDMPWSPSFMSAAKGADILFSTSSDILNKYADLPISSVFIEHGVSEDFLNDMMDFNPEREVLRVGYSGNLLRHDIDRDIFLRIVKENSSVIFECWGSYGQGDGNLGGVKDAAGAAFISDLKACSNVILHGAVSPAKLARAMAQMDAFLICYDLSAPNVIGPNYHKLMEFFSTGKVIISTFIKHYIDRPDLIQMVSQDGNNDLPALFRAVISKINDHNRLELMTIRKDWARSNSYCKQIDRIDIQLASLNKIS